MEDTKLIDTPMPINGNLKRNEIGKDVNVKKYRGMIGSLLYLTASKSDIMFSVCICTCYQLAPKESHLKAIKCILRYLYGTSKYGLCHSKGSDYNLVGYTDSNFAGYKSDRKSTSGTCHMFSNSLISWHSKKQVFISLSNAKEEYIEADNCCAHILWLKQQLLDFYIKLQRSYYVRKH
ncbi:secreted RxLR effector protein 161-like [Lathyrus oleraceus]|uniref:secreted RxLR effector protein 161-like n=1 Tax=Pisum sativum TaxID=3888 RepID=UPI0021CEA937|nr:secreted RxLR effector protein 161-like [Pisum sativum]